MSARQTTITFPAPVAEPVAGTDLALVLAPEVRLDVRRGPFGTVALWRGDALLHTDRLALDYDAARVAYADAAAKKAGDHGGAIGGALLALSGKVHQELDRREQARGAGTAGQGLYVVEDGRICRRQEGGAVPLCNFAARITHETLLDDGTDNPARRELAIAGSLDSGAALPVARVGTTNFAGMNWVLDAWGIGARIRAGNGTRDQLREALQLLSPDASHETVFTHSGWRKLAGTWRYLHEGGEIGTVRAGIGTVASPFYGQLSRDFGPFPGASPEGDGGSGTDGTVGTEKTYTTRLGDKLQSLRLPDPPVGEARIAAIRASLGLIDLAPDRVAVPLLGAAYRAVLCEPLAADVSLFLHGVSGTFKTELTVLCQQHFGAGFNRLNLPANWASTPNMIEKLSSDCKDAVMVIDDHVPTGSQQEVRKLNAATERIFRGAGNHAGRGRMNADGSIRATYYPRGLIVSSGEDIPPGYSLGARLYLVALGRGDVKPDALSDAQRAGDDGLYAEAMAAYVRWLAPCMDGLKRYLPLRLVALRDRLAKGDGHRRAPTAVAHLLIGWELFATFAVEAGALTRPEADATLARVRKALQEGMMAQEQHARTQSPALRFVELIGAAVASGRYHVAGPDGDAPEAPQRWGYRSRTYRDGAGEEQISWHPANEQGRIGFADGDDLYLLPDLAYSAVQQAAAQQQGTPFMQQRTLWKHLADAGLLRTRDEQRERFTVRKTLGGERVQVLHMSAPSGWGVNPPSQPSQPSQSPETGPPSGLEGEATGPESGTVDNKVGRSGDGLGHSQRKHADNSGSNGTVGTVGTVARAYTTTHDDEYSSGFGANGDQAF